MLVRIWNMLGVNATHLRWLCHRSADTWTYPILRISNIYLQVVCIFPCERKHVIWCKTASLTLHSRREVIVEWRKRHNWILMRFSLLLSLLLPVFYYILNDARIHCVLNGARRSTRGGGGGGSINNHLQLCAQQHSHWRRSILPRSCRVAQFISS